MFSKKTALALFSMVVVLSVLAAQCGAPAGTPQTIVEKVVETVIVEKEGETKIETVVVERTVEVEKEVVKEVEIGALPAEETYFDSFGLGDVPTLDPSIAEDTSSIQAGVELFVGLTRLHEETGAVEPGMATEWDISEDGLVYTFHLRDDVPWVKYDNTTGEVTQVTDDEGNPRIVNCNDFLYGIRRTLNPATGSNYAYVNWIIKNAQAVSGGSDLADQDPLYGNLEEIGAQCLDDWTMEITLNEPAAYFPGVASMWISWAQPQWLIEDPVVGDRWIEAGIMQTYGPYALREWTHDVSMTLQANPFWPGTDAVPQPSIKYLNFSMLDDSAQLANYEAGLLDRNDQVPLPELDRIKADPVLSQELSTPGQLCTYYYGFNVTKPPFDDPNVRRAFSWAIDRQAIVDNVTKGGQIPARWFSRPGLTAAPDPAKGDDFGPPATADIEAAKEFLAASSYGSAEALPEITLMANQVEGHVVIAEAIQQMWNENLGVNVNLVTQEWAVFLDTLDTDPPQVWRLGWCYDYPDASNFARDVFRSDSGNNHTKWVNEEYDQIVDQAAFETDEQVRHDLYVEAEKLLVEEEAAIIPIYWYTNMDLTKPYVTRTFGTGGQEAFEKWSINK
jgi:oligopeptide transport system substrate-binding protein